MASEKQKGAESDADGDTIQRNLRKAYSDVVAEPLPDKLADLLAKLKAGDKPDAR